MSYFKDEGYEPRTFYLNALYLIMTLLGILFAITLNAEVSATDTVDKKITADNVIKKYFFIL